MSKTLSREEMHLRLMRKIKNYLKDVGGWQFIRCATYLKRQRGFYQHDECYCKLCGALIQKLVPHPEIPNRLVLAVLPSYKEIEILFDDGSRHITPICSDCARGRIKEEALKESYYADLLAFDAEEEFGASPWEIMEREPISWSLLK